ncbi:hypothetical protein [Exiguobacterium sp. NG55]|uniref:hypothetical protein n=1 Tax=Exiguobacterium sp. NG55 TaxID=375477 RepID=UPI0004DEF44C|nr:hypothetical protein [Exiguobacterium sp. NG55]
MFSDDLIKEFMEFREVNGEKFTWWSFVNYKYNIEDALSFLKFFNPEIVCHESCYFLKDSLSLDSYKGWKEEFGTDLSSIEKMINLYEPKDFFIINDINDLGSSDKNKKIEAFAEALCQQWQVSLQERYKNIPFQVQLIREGEDLYITMFVLR